MAKSISSAFVSRRSLLITLGHQGQRKIATQQWRHLRTQPPRMERGAHGYLTPAEATSLLRRGESAEESLVTGAVSSYDRNVLHSNDPCEDAHGEALIKEHLRRDCVMFSVVDGHGGPDFGKALISRIFSYVAAGLVSSDALRGHITELEHAEVGLGQEDESGGRRRDDDDLTEILHQSHGDPYGTMTPDKLPPGVLRMQKENYLRYLRTTLEQIKEEEAKAAALQKELESSSSERSMRVSRVQRHLRRALVALDDDIGEEVMNPPSGSVDYYRRVGSSGAVAAIALFDRGDLHVASTGDCSIVLGSLSENDTWVATKLTQEHSAENPAEASRIMEEHPGEPGVLRDDRLLGMLAPFRALGDYKFKWPAEQIQASLGSEAVPPNYSTPPYLTAEPEMTVHALTPHDKFLVLGSDGLWDMMTPMQVIRLVGEHLSGKFVLKPLVVPEESDVRLGDIASVLRRRRHGLKLKPTDSNGATHLIRSGLGGSAYGMDHSKLSQALTLPAHMKRLFRDDITVTVVYFDAQYIKNLEARSLAPDDHLSRDSNGGNGDGNGNKESNSTKRSVRG